MPIRRLFGLLAFALSLLSVPAVAQTVEFVHGFEGAETIFYLEETEAWVRVTDPAADASSAAVDMLSVTVTTALSGDSEIVDLWETYRDSGVFEGRIKLARNATPNLLWVLETGFTAGPPDVFDTLTAQYGAATATAEMVAVHIQILDEHGRQATSLINGDWVNVRLEDHVRADDPWMRDTVSVLVQNPDMGDSELLTLTETALRTGVFEGRLRHLTPQSPSGDGVIGGYPFHQILARYDVPGYPEDAQASAMVLGSRVEALGADGRPTTLVPESSPLRLRVTNRAAAEYPSVDTVDVVLYSQITGDDETVFLTETGPATGIFEGTLPMTVFGLAQDGDGTLTTGELLGPPHFFDAVHISYTDGFNNSGTTLISVGTYASETRFTDAEGKDAESYAAGFPAWVRVEDHNVNQPAVVDTIQATVESLTEGDSEALVLTETGQDTAIFSGSMQLAADPGTAGDGILQGQFDDTLRVLHGDALGMTASGDLARLRGNRLQFVDADGRAVGEVLENGTARVRVEMAVCNGSPYAIDTCPLVFTTRLHGDAENIQLTETDADTGVFVGEIPTPFAFFDIPYNGALEIGNSGSPEYLPDVITASAGSEIAIVPTAPFTLRFVHADGEDAPAFAAGEAVGLRLEDHTGNDPQVLQAETLQIHLIASTEAEPVTLTETGYDTGVYVGSLPSQLSGSPTLNSGTLDVEIGSRLRVERSSATDLREIRDEAAVSGSAPTPPEEDSPVTFRDAWGNPANGYTAGTRAYVRVEDAAANLLPSLYDTVEVTLFSLTSGDSETVTLRETARDSGVFEGSAALGWTPGLDCVPGEEIEAVYGEFSDRAVIRYSSAEFVDEAGEPTGEVLENGVARLRVTSFDPGSSVGVTVRSLHGADQENVTLTETSPGSQVYEGTVQLSVVAPGNGSSGNGTLDTANSGSPDYLGDTLTVSYQDGEGTAATIPSRVMFIDAFGRVTTTFAVSEYMGVRVEDHNLDNPLVKESIQVIVREAGGGYPHPLALTETGYDTNVYEGAFADGLFVVGGLEIEAEHQNEHTPNPTVAQATITGAAVIFLDAEGRPAELYLEKTRTFVRVIDPAANYNSYADMVQVSLSSMFGLDSESLTLFETGGSTGVFEGSIALGTGYGSPDNGMLETDQFSGPPHEFDTLTARYESVAAGMFTAIAGTIGSRVWFLDAYGNETDAYTAGTAAYVRVEDHVRAVMPDAYDIVQVTLHAETGDSETITLRETARDNGIFEGSLSLEMSSPSPGDVKLQSMPGEVIEVVHTDAPGNSSSSDTAVIRYASAMFIDEASEPTGEVLENGVARLRVIGSDPVSTVGVTVRSQRGADQENVTLNETFPGSRVYEGTVQLFFVPPGYGVSNNGTLDTANSGMPEYLGDPLTVSYQDAEGAAVTIPSRVRFIDSFGAVAATFAVGERVGVRVEDHNLDDPQVRNAIQVLVREAGGGDAQSLTLTETGYDTNVYEGGLDTENAPVSSGDGRLQVQPGDVIEAERLNENTPYPTVAQATMGRASVFFLDAEGRPASRYLERTTAYVRVIDKGSDYNSYADIVQVSFSSLLGLDGETLSLFETGGSTGVFEGSITLSNNSANSSNGTLETGQYSGPPHEFDTITATYLASFGMETPVSTTAGMIGSRVWFLDAYGNDTEGYTAGTTAYLRVEDHVANSIPSLYDTVQVTLQAPETGDTEMVTLRETSRDSGIFEGSLRLEKEDYPPSPSPGDGKLQSMPGEEIEAIYDDYSGDAITNDTVVIRYSSAMFVDEAGEPTGEVLENGVARLRVLGSDPGSTVGVTVRSQRGADQENVTLNETFPGSQVYEGTVQLFFVPPGNGFANNGTLDTANSGMPEYLGDVLTVSYQDSEGTAVTIPSRVRFIDSFGAVAATIAVGERVGVRVEDHNLDDPLVRGSLQVLVYQVGGGDSEPVTLTETGYDTNVYEGGLDSETASMSPGRLQVQAGAVIEAERLNENTPNPTRAQAVMSRAAVIFLDAQGRPADCYYERTTAYVRVINKASDYNPFPDIISVWLYSALGYDSETLSLVETGGSTGVFEGSISLSSNPANPNNGTFETGQFSGPPHEFDTITARYELDGGPVTDTVGMIGSRTWFIDNFGNEADGYAAGSTARVRVRDHNADMPEVNDTVQVTLRSLGTGDEETVIIPQVVGEGVFEGYVPLERTPTPTPNDGKLQSMPGEEIEVVHTDVGGGSTSSDRALIRSSEVLIHDPSVAGEGEVLENGLAHIQVIDTTAGSSLNVVVRSRDGEDEESVFLTSIGQGTFQGNVPLSFVPQGGGIQNNGTLETSNSGAPEYLQDELTATYLDAEGLAVTVPSRIGFLSLAEDVRVTEYAVGSLVRVRVQDRNANDPGQIDTTTVLLSTPGDSESLTLTETSEDSGIFLGELPSSATPGAPQDGTLTAGPGTVAMVEHLNAHTPHPTTVQLPFNGNFAPLAVNDAAQTEQEAVVIDVLANDSDPDQDPLGISWFWQGTHGSVSLESGALRYTPEPEFVGTDTFNYVVGDSHGGESRATVTVTVLLANLPPKPADDSATTPEDQAVNIAVLANDSDPDDDPLHVLAVGLPSNGTAEVQPDDTITFTPDPNWSGQATFTYMVEDPDGSTAYATVTVTVTPVNDPPVANDDTLQVDEDGFAFAFVLDNDSDSENDPLDIVSVTQGASGTVALNEFDDVTYTPAANFSGADSFTYAISDGNGGTDTATVAVTVSPANDAPVAVDDSATTDEDTAVTVAVLANDTDLDNDTLNVTSVTAATNGVPVLNADETVTFTPAEGFHGTATFDYVMNDGNGGSDVGTVTITVNPVNDPPVAVDDTAVTDEDSSVTVTVLANDTDADDDTLEVTAITQGANGTVTLDPVTYTPAANFHGTDSFTYTVSDGNGGTDTATVNVTINEANDAPVANDDSATVAEDGSVSISVLGNDSDADDDDLTVTAVTQGTNGSVILDPVTYTPNANFHGTDSFTYTISDGNGGTDTATVTITVTPVNDAPAANDDTASVVEDDSVTVNVLGNDTDADNDTLTVTAVTQGANGAVTLDPVTYTPSPNFFGTDSFTYTIGDGNGGADTATVTVTVAPSNDALTANDDSATVAEDGSVTVAVLANDTDPENDPLGIQSVTQGTNGSVSIAGSQVTYTPNPDFHGADSFTYTASDGNGGTGSATVTVTVTPVNDDPVAGDDTASVVEDGSVAITVLGNDADVDEDLLSVTSVTQGAHGSVVINPDDTVTYTPEADYNGSDSFTYTISDGNGGEDTATVTMTVGAANDAPVANGDSASTAEDNPVTVSVLGNDTDLENDTLSVSAVTQGANGAVAIVGSQVTYTPGADFHGTDSFTYTASDGNGGTDTATVNVTVTPVNDAPVANDDPAAVAEDGSVTVSVVANDTDADNDTLTVTAVTQGAHGTVTLNPVTYTPAANYNGPDSFSYTVIDGHGGTDTATVNVTVGAANDAPVANDDTATVAEDGSVSVSVLGNDTDLDNDTLTVTAVTQGANGTVTLNSVTYTPAANYNGPDTFTYTISDGNGGSDTATVTVTVTSVNDAPLAVDDSATTLAETPVTIQVRDNDTDVEGATLTITAVTQGAHGLVAINAGQTVTYTPALTWVGPDSFTYTISDGAGGTATATVNVTVQAPPRVTANIQVLYPFNEGSGTTVNDTSGVGTPLNLTVASAAAVTWLPGALSINSNTLIQTAGTATKVINACKSANQVTVEAWVDPLNLTQTGPAAIVTISQTNSKRDVTLGQSGTAYNGQLRTSSTGQGGTQHNASGVATTNLTHVVYTRSNTGAVRIYVNGNLVTSATLSGNLTSWDNYNLALGGELSGTRYWRGELHLVAIYSRALTSTEVRQNFLAGAN